jgi:predicted  nucleic acid-binding Zn-ribbon protein
MFLVVVILVAIVVLILCKSHTQRISPSAEAGKLAREVSDEGRRLSGKAPEDIVASLRQKIQDLKKSWSNHGPEVEDLNRRVEALRTTIEEHKKQAADLLRTQSEDLRQRAEALVQSIKAKGEKVPTELDDLLRTLRPLAGAPPAETPAEATSDPTPTPVEK